MLAVVNCEYQAMDLLLDANCDVLARDKNSMFTAGYFAILDDDLEAFKKLFHHNFTIIKESYGTYNIYTFMSYSCAVNILNFAFKSFGLSPNYKDPQEVSLLEHVLAETVEDKKAQADTIRLLSARGCDLNGFSSHGNSFLIEALEKNQFKAANVLISEGINCHVKNSEGTSALIIAATKNQFKLVYRLIKEGVNINEKDSSGLTALHHAARLNNVDMLEFLLEQGADQSITDPFGNTACHLASFHGNPAISILALNDANFNQENLIGNTPLTQLINDEKWDAVTYILLGMKNLTDLSSNQIDILIDKREKLLQASFVEIDQIPNPDDRLSVLVSLLNQGNALGILLQKNKSNPSPIFTTPLQGEDCVKQIKEHYKELLQPSLTTVTLNSKNPNTSP